MKWRHNTPLRYKSRDVVSPVADHGVTGTTLPTASEPVPETPLPPIGLFHRRESVEVPTPLTTPTDKQTVKPGVHTSEFYIMLIANAIALLNADHVWTFFSPSTSGVIMAVVTAAYALSRGWAKSG